ncbi:hypothetical protein ARAF_0431 [Arsenophonus endosymbiont of Aleurodicus floccissimus]|nr:hypothetical protein ARAF_0431 [Arsenophonus endosymbiont of Aleurodicus floccissimus]
MQNLPPHQPIDGFIITAVSHWKAPLSDKTSPFAEEGSAAHALAESILKMRQNPYNEGCRRTCGFFEAKDYIGTYPLLKANSPQVDEEMIEHVQTYINTVWQLADGKILQVEKRVDFSAVIGVENSFGTADMIIVSDDELQIHDLKYGKGVKVEAQNNAQLMLYALWALHQFDLVYDFKTVWLFIHQPRLNHLSEWALSVEDLKDFGDLARLRAQKAMEMVTLAERSGLDALPDSTFSPGIKQCQFYKAKGGMCFAQTQFVHNEVKGDFIDLTQPLAPQLSEATKRTTLLTHQANGKTLPACRFDREFL